MRSAILALALLISLCGVAFSLNVKLGPETGPFQTKEPKDNGGGNAVECKEAGFVVSKVQLGRDPDGQRWINIYCRKLIIQ
jgi:hypothetical protein